MVCALAFQAHADETFVLGTSFVKNYYTIFDMENDMIGLSPHT